MASRKESQLTTQATFASGDLLTGLRSGQNVNFSYAGVYNAIWGNGSFNQIGNPLGVPTLVQPSSGVNNFRNIESAKGVIASVSAEDGINIACNFSQSLAGFTLIKNLNADKYEFKTLLAGQNIGITDTGDSLRVDFTGSATSTKTVVISQESDFPAAVGGVITLLSDTDYLLVQDVTTANRFVIGNPTTLRATSTQMVELTYTGADVMLTGVEPSLKVMDMSLNCPNGTLLDMTATGGNSLIQMVEVNITDCVSLGNIDGAFITRFTNTAFVNMQSSGISFSGENDILIFDTHVAFVSAGPFIDFGTATFRSVSIEGGIVNGIAPGVTWLKGAAGSANIIPGGQGSIMNNKTFDIDTQLDGLTTDDIRWNFQTNNHLPNSIDDGLVYTTGNLLQTTILAIGASVKANAVFTTEDVSRFVADGTGRLTYIGESNSRLPIDVTSTLLMAAGGDKQVNLCIAINGTVITPTCVQETASSSKAAAISTIWQYEFEPNDYVEIFVSNESNTDNIIVTQAILRIN